MGNPTRSAIPAQELKAIAENLSKYISIRTYVDGGNSLDSKRLSTPEEQSILTRIFYAALLTLRTALVSNSPDCAYAIISNAEYTAMQFIENCNTYDTIAQPLDSVIENWGGTSINVEAVYEKLNNRCKSVVPVQEQTRVPADRQCCFNCARCSILVKTMVDVCDVDQHVIQDAEVAIDCENFLPAEAD